MGLEQVDANWWRGALGDQTGIFPVTHVTDIGVKPDSSTAPKTLDKQSPDLVMARGLIDCTAQLDDELSFQAGDMIYIIEAVDGDFFRGECKGKQGIFLASCVEIVCGDLNQNVSAGHSHVEAQNHMNSEGYPSMTRQSSIGGRVPLETPKPRTQSIYKEPSVDKVHFAPAPKMADPPKPRTQSFYKEPSIDQSNVDLQSHDTITNQSSFTCSNTRSYDAEITAYGKTLFPFVAENSNELTFMDNEIVTLIRHVDHQWMEGEIDGKKGIFPVAYIEIIVDCPESEEYQQGAAPQTAENGLSPQAAEPEMDASEEEIYARVLFDFVAATKDDLSVQEGDTVTVLGKVDENWYRARHDNGQIGLCPVNYLEVIGSDPGLAAPPPSVTLAPQSPSPSSSGSVSLPTSLSVDSGAPTQLGQTSPAAPKPTPARSISVDEVATSKPSLRPKPQLKPKPGKPSRPLSDAALDAMIQGEISQARSEADSRSRSSSTHSDQDMEKLHVAPSTDTNNYYKPVFTAPVKTDSVLSDSCRDVPDGSRTPQATANYDALREVTSQAARQPVRRPPGPPTRPTSSATTTKRAPPPRPVGPKLAPAPSKAPLIPVPQNLGPKPVPQRAAPPRPGYSPTHKGAAAPARPASSAPPRPANSSHPGGSDLIGFSPGASVTGRIIYELSSNQNSSSSRYYSLCTLTLLSG